MPRICRRRVSDLFLRKAQTYRQIKKKTDMKRTILIGAILGSTLGAAALAHNGATGLVLERMNGMSAMKKVMGQLAPMMQGEIPFDIMAVQQGAATLMAHGGDNMTKLFPKEDIPAASYAVPAIWSEWDRFQAMAAELKANAFGLAMAAPNGPTAPPTAMEGMAGMDGMEGMAGMTDAVPAAEPELSIGQLMGVEPRDKSVGRNGPANTAATSDGTPPTIDFATMSAPAAFEMVSRTCASCHAQFRRGS